MSFKDKIKRFFKEPIRRTKFVTYITMVYNFFWACAKIAFGFFMRSYLYCVSGGYTLLIGFTKRIFIKSHNKTTANTSKETVSTLMGVLLLISGLAFGLYMGSLLIWPREYRYGLIWSIGIAACSFAELGVAIFNLSRVKKKNDILLSSLRCCNFISAIFAIVITQVAILSATATENTSLFNAISGLIAGGIAIAIGTLVIIKSCNKEKQNKLLAQQTEILETADEIVEILTEEKFED